MPHDHHDHLSPSGHPYRADDDVPLTYWHAMEIAVRELLIEKGVTTAQDINAQIETAFAFRQRARRHNNAPVTSRINGCRHRLPADRNDNRS